MVVDPKGTHMARNVWNAIKITLFLNLLWSSTSCALVTDLELSFTCDSFTQRILYPGPEQVQSVQSVTLTSTIKLLPNVSFPSACLWAQVSLACVFGFVQLGDVGDGGPWNSYSVWLRQVQPHNVQVIISLR